MEGKLNHQQQHAIPSGLHLRACFNKTMASNTHFRLCHGYLTKEESDGALLHLTWLPQSPDLNLLEHFTDMLMTLNYIYLRGDRTVKLQAKDFVMLRYVFSIGIRAETIIRITRVI